MWKEKIEAVLSSYELQFKHHQKSLHPSRQSVINTVRDFLSNHHDFMSFCVVISSYMEKHYRFKTIWWTLFLVKTRSQLFDMIECVIIEISKDNDVKNLRIELNHTKKQIAQIKTDHQNEINQLKEVYESKQNMLINELKDKEKALSERVMQHESQLTFMKKQIDVLLCNQDDGVLQYIHALQDEVYAQHAKV